MDNEKIYLDSNQLKLILSENKDYISKPKYAGIEKILSGIAFWIPMVLADFGKWGTIGIVVQTLLTVAGVFYMLYGIWELYKVNQHPFSEETLYDKIAEANLMKEHPHSIVLIKDTFKNNPNRYLLYYDSRWKCRLFLNYTTADEKYDIDEDNISKHLQMELKTDRDNLLGTFEFEKVHEKFSVSANEQRCYRHRFYQYQLKDFPNALQQDEFEIDGKTFYWMSIADMEQDDRIMEVNSDIVSFVKAR